MEDICQVRMIILALPEVPRFMPTTIRVHLVPELPNQVAELMALESAECTRSWSQPRTISGPFPLGLVLRLATRTLARRVALDSGFRIASYRLKPTYPNLTCTGGVTKRVGESHVMSLCEGANLSLRYHGQEEQLVWRGTSVSADFTFVPPTDPARLGRRSFDEKIVVDVLASSTTRRASRAEAVAKRAGLSSAVDHEVPFTLTPSATARPGPPADFALAETWQDGSFVLRWLPPALKPGERRNRKISRYALELSVTGAKGTYGPYQEIWVGKGVPFTDRKTFEQPLASGGNRTRTVVDEPGLKSFTSTLSGLQKTIDGALSSPRDASAKYADLVVPLARNGATAEEGVNHGIVDHEEDDDPGAGANAPLAYLLTVPASMTAGLVGKLRLRCWSVGSPIPSEYSPEARVKPAKGKQGKPSAKEKDAAARRDSYFLANGQVARKAGTDAGARWGADAQRASASRTSQAQLLKPTKSKSLSSRVTAVEQPTDPAAALYNVPVPPPMPGLETAGAAMAVFFETVGVVDGICFGLNIEHVLHAVAAGSTTATLQQPLMCLLEVVYSDALLPLADTAAVLQPAWQFAMEKVGGITKQLLTYAPSYSSGEVASHCQAQLMVMFDLYETMRQCDAGMMLTLHLGDRKNYGKRMVAELRDELEGKILDVLWRYSTGLLKLQVHVASLSASRDGGRSEDAAAELSSLAAMEGTHDATRMQLIAYLGLEQQQQRVEGGKARGSGMAMMRWMGVVK